MSDINLGYFIELSPLSFTNTASIFNNDSIGNLLLDTSDDWKTVTSDYIISKLT